MPTSLPTQHPQRQTLTNEIHARPFLELKPPMRATMVSILSGEETEEADRAHLRALCDHYNVGHPAEGARHFAINAGPMILRWERHGEFSTYQFLREEQEVEEDPFTDPVIALLPRDWLAGLPGELLVGLHIATEPTVRDPKSLARLFNHQEPIGSDVAGGAGRVWTDFRLHTDHFGRILIEDHGLTAPRAGRLVQRLIEIETYRMLALLALPLAQEMTPKTRRLHEELTTITGLLDDPEAQADSQLLKDLINLASVAEEMVLTTSYRFAATRAYAALVTRRLEELRETRIEGFQTIQEFLERRLLPAVQTCVAVEQRLNTLTERVARTGNLLRTRVNIAMEEQNSALLASMDRRAKIQVRMQSTVEGLSVVAISYYLVGLIGYIAKGVDNLGFPLHGEVVTAIAVPLVVGLVSFGLNRIRRALFG